MKRKLGGIFLWAGKFCAQRKMAAEALFFLRASEKINPDNEAKYQLALLFKSLGWQYQAEDLIDQIAISGDGFQYYWNDRPVAVDHFLRAAERHYACKEYEKALNYFFRALKMNHPAMLGYRAMYHDCLAKTSLGEIVVNSGD